MSIRKVLISTLLLPVLLYSPTSFADKEGKGHGKHGKHYEDNDHGKHKHKKSKKHDDDNDHVHVIFEDHDRVVIREYITREYASCPPGLAKKHNGCLPPGIAKKRYVIGQPLYVEWQEIPHDLLINVGAPPVGYRYVMVDKDVLLISEASKKVIDAVTLLSAVGN